jgi:26S proteasome regulatory subunit N2
MFSEMLIGHFNGHTRYGAAMALAISSAGSGFEVKLISAMQVMYVIDILQKAISLIEPLLQDKENFVRQGALIAMAILMIQHVEGSCANVVRFRKRLLEIITEKGEDTIVKVQLYN